MSDNSDRIIGIDLGTSNSVVCVMQDNGQFNVIADERGMKVQPSVVSFHPNGSVLVGAEAKQRRIVDPRNTVYSIKRLIGRPYDAPEIAQAQGRAPFSIKEGSNKQPVIVTRAGDFAIPEISALVLNHMHVLAKRALGCEANRAVITVPANFNDAQRSATATAGAIAGITVVRVLNEPTAAALAYGHLRRLNQIIAVYDFGGGTFDVTILQLKDAVFEVLGTAGDSFLGGDDIDEKIVDHLSAAFTKQHRLDLAHNETALQRLYAVAEQVKIELSRKTRAVVKIDELAYGVGGAPINFEHALTRDELNAMAGDIVAKTFQVCDEALKYAGLSSGQVQDVVLVGGTSKMQLVRDKTRDYFGRTPRTDINPDEAIAMGAGLQARSLEKILGGGATVTGLGAVGVAPQPKMEKPILATDRAPTRGVHSDRLPSASGVPTGAALGRITTRGHSPGTSPGNSGGIGKINDLSGPTPQSEPRTRTASIPPPLPPEKSGRSFSDKHRAGPPGPVDNGWDSEVPTRQQTPGASLPDGQSDWLDTNNSGVEAIDTGLEAAIAEITAPPASGLAAVAASLRAAATPPVEVWLPTPLGLRAQPVPQVFTAGKAEVNDATTAAPQAPTVLDISPVIATPVAAAAPTLAPATAVPFTPLPEPAPLRPTEILEVTPHGLGIGTVGGYCEEILPKNVRIPFEKSRVFATSQDNQRLVKLKIFSGESKRLGENTPLGDLILQGITPRPRGETKIEVTFNIDASGMLQVQAKDVQTGTQQQATLSLLGAQSHQEVEAAGARLRQLRRNQ